MCRCNYFLKMYVRILTSLILNFINLLKDRNFFSLPKIIFVTKYLNHLLYKIFELVTYFL